MIFGTLNLEKIWHENLTSHLPDVAIVPLEIKKVIISSIIYAYFWLFLISQKKTNCNPLSHLTRKKCHYTNLWIATFFIWLKICCVPSNVGGSESRLWHWWFWREPIVMCGNFNVRQALSQQVFRVTTFCINTCFQSFSTLISHIVHYAVLKFSPCCNKSLPQAATCPNQYTCSSSPPVVCPRRSTRAVQIIGSTKQQ